MSTAEGQYSDEFIEWARQVKTSKRAQKALEFLLDQGTVTTDDLKNAGYDHPPRAVRDLKDAGFAITSANVSVDGRRMARYTLLDSMSEDFAQRRPISNSFRDKLFREHGHRCAVCGAEFITRMLQADHRVPFHIGGDPAVFETADFMPLCSSDNRAKSMSCETCPNWEVRNPDTCRTCYWHDPDDYDHVATIDERRLVLTVHGDRIGVIDAMKAEAGASDSTLGEVVLSHLEQAVRRQ
ncbi:HNH endonuclease [Streptomyces sp. NPDC058045]|uniref:HNH endonuclease n=1 Tax=Streptomyces sp. NPDC058045 TaxID=3346311 RepID=UPI0036EC1F29